MDFRRQNDDENNDSSFPKPLLPSSSSLVPNARGGARNSSLDLSPASEGGKRDSFNFRLAGELSPAKYRECLRNHAASVGGHILDGCGEFMPTSSDAMKCAACGCHRSFHRREGESDNLSQFHHHHNGRGRIPLLLPPPQLLPHQKHIHSLGNAGGGGATTESSSEELGLPASAHIPFVAPSSKKRFRTKFSAEQKARMMDFAERIGWRIQRQDEAEMEAFCAGVGVSRQVFKVWMHNNKHSVLKQQNSPPPPPFQQP